MARNRLQQTLRVTFIGLTINALLAAVKLVAGVIGHSHALVADAVESFADVFSSLIVWRGLVVAAAPADKDHPYGHGKAEPIAAALVATMLLLAAGWIILQALEEIARPHSAPAPFTLVVLVAVVVVKEGLYRFVWRTGTETDSAAVRSDAWHHRSDAVTSLAAFLGISVSLIGGPGYASADGVAAIVAAGIIAWNGWRLLRPALDELMDTAPPPDVVEQICAVGCALPRVERVEKCVVRKMGYYYYVDMHVEVEPQMTVEQAHLVAHEVKDHICRELPRVRDVLVHVEPAGQPRKENAG